MCMRGSLEAVIEFLIHHPKFQIPALHDEALEAESTFGLLAVGKQNDCLATLAFAHEPQLYAAPNKIESFKDLFNIPAVQGVGEASHLHCCLAQQRVDLQLVTTPRARPRI